MACETFKYLADIFSWTMPLRMVSCFGMDVKERCMYATRNNGMSVNCAHRQAHISSFIWIETVFKFLCIQNSFTSKRSLYISFWNYAQAVDIQFTGHCPIESKKWSFLQKRQVKRDRKRVNGKDNERGREENAFRNRECKAWVLIFWSSSAIFHLNYRLQQISLQL